ncbi:MAG: methyltransferase domain-containing protein [Candidatus Lokiarchaeota archaeon]|nr:methyltransferase domain-containing protein [Candidatus Lokiarchaeota archaeon]
MTNLDKVERENSLRFLITNKSALKELYIKYYYGYLKCLNRCQKTGKAVELGSGVGFSKQIVPELVTTDILPYSNIDICVDAMNMPFENNSLKVIFMLNTLHHIPDAEFFFSEAIRCLRPKGRIFIIDQYPGIFSYFIFKYFHHEYFDHKAENWKFSTTGPLSGANGALAWIIFYRDREIFKQLFPELIIQSINRHTPFSYWLAGGLKSWSLVPKPFYPMLSRFDDFVSRMIPSLGSFVTVELMRR